MKFALCMILGTFTLAGCATTTVLNNTSDKTRHYASLPSDTTRAAGPVNSFGQLYHYPSEAAYEQAEGKPLTGAVDASER